MFDTTMQLFPTIAFIVACAWMFIPIRICINFVIGEQVEIEPQYNKSYEEVYAQFASYYDKENPITQKKGQLRILDMQIKEAESKGDTKAVEQLRGQQTVVNSVNMFQQMQSYTVQNQARHAAYAQAHVPFGGGMMMAGGGHHAMMVQQQMMAAQQQRMMMQNQAMMMQQRT